MESLSLNASGTVELLVTRKTMRTTKNDTVMMIVDAMDIKGVGTRVVSYAETAVIFEPKLTESKAYRFCNAMVSKAMYGNVEKELKLTMNSNVVEVSASPFAAATTSLSSNNTTLAETLTKPADARVTSLSSNNTTLAETLTKPADARVDVRGVVMHVADAVGNKRKLHIADETGVTVEVSAYNDAASIDIAVGDVLHCKRAKIMNSRTLGVFDAPDKVTDDEKLNAWYATNATGANLAIADLTTKPFGALCTVEGVVENVSDVVELQTTTKRTLRLHDATAGIEVSLFDKGYSMADSTLLSPGAHVRLEYARLTNWNGRSLSTTTPPIAATTANLPAAPVDGTPMLSEASMPRVADKLVDCKTIAAAPSGTRCNVAARLDHDGVAYALTDPTGSVAVKFHNATPPPVGCLIEVKNAKRLDTGLMIYADTPLTLDASSTYELRDWASSSSAS